jgi:hypothetical protein
MLDRKNYNIFEIPLCRQLTRACNLNMEISTFFSSKCQEFRGFFYQKDLCESHNLLFVAKQQKNSPKKCWLRCVQMIILLRFESKKMFCFLLIRTYFTHTLQKLHYQKWTSKWFVFQKSSLKFIKIGWKLEFNSQ